jgi:hypothetical protein
MTSRGAFGYKIGRKLRLMYVDSDAELLWQILVREIFVLMKHYGTVDLLREEFLKLKDTNKVKLKQEKLKQEKLKQEKLKQEIIEKCKIYRDNKIMNDSINDWRSLLIYCQHSFINILGSGFFINDGTEDSGLILLLDFNTNSVIFYNKDYKKEMKIREKATIDEIMEFEEMPVKTLTEIMEEMKTKYIIYEEKTEKIRIEREKIESIINKANELGGEQNIIKKAKELLDTLNWEKKKLDLNYRVFYDRLDALNLIDYDNDT